MLLVIDIGNTNTSLGVYDGEKLVAHWRLTTARSRTVDEWGVHARNLFALAGLDFKSIDAIAIASVVPPLNFTLKQMAERYFELTPLFIDHTIDTGVEMTRAHGQEMTSRTSDRYTQTDQLAPKISGGASATITAIASTAGV